jgi:hypothetical protein
VVALELKAYRQKREPRSLERPLPQGGAKMALEEDGVSSNRFIEKELDKKLSTLGKRFDSDILVLIAPMRPPIDELVRDSVEGVENRKDSLTVMLETEGGSIEVVERIADVFRYHYSKEINFIIPNYAMSAGTILAMSGDNILMDYFSVLGPIDPQVRRPSMGDRFVPALGYLAKYDELIKKSASGKLTAAEIAFLVEKFDPAELHQFEQARELSVELLKRWLVQYKFKNWEKTRTTCKVVTQKMKEDRASKIARLLNDTKKWKSHGRGLSKGVLDKELNLIIEDFGADPELRACVRAYYWLLQDFMARVRQSIVVHAPGRYLGL